MCNPDKFGYAKSLHIRATRDWDIPSKLRFDAIYPSMAILSSRQFKAAYWLNTNLIPISWRVILTSLVILSLFTFEVHVFQIFLQNSVLMRFDPSVAILGSRQFRAAYWLITTKTLVVGGTLLTQSFSFLNDQGTTYHSLYMQTPCSEPKPYASHIGWPGITLVQGGILADNDQVDTHVLNLNPHKFGYPKSLYIRATHGWDLRSKLRFDAIYPIGYDDKIETQTHTACMRR